MDNIVRFLAHITRPRPYTDIVPRKGDIWRHIDKLRPQQQGPWKYVDTENAGFVYILACKEEWVRYSFLLPSVATANDQRMKLDNFQYMYRCANKLMTEEENKSVKQSVEALRKNIKLST